MSRIQRPRALAINLFKNKPELMLRKMLADPKRVWTGPELAKEVGVQRIWASRVLTTLEFEKFAEREGQGAHSKYRLANVDKLLQRWKLSYHIGHNEHHSYRVVDRDPIKLISLAAKKEGFRYAVTCTVAKALAAGKKCADEPYIYIWPHSGVDGDFRKLLDVLEDKYDFIPTEKKANLILLKPYAGEGVFEKILRIENLWIGSQLQIQLDTPPSSLSDSGST